jgi:hypothetical protein
MKVDLHIEELIMHGFAPEDRYRIGDAVEKELANLLAERGMPPLENGLEIAGLNVGDILIAKGAKPQAIGAQVARAVYGGLKR